MDADQRTSSSLLDLARRRDGKAWERIIALYGPLVAHWCRNRRLMPDEVDEVFQEVFLAANRGLPSFLPDGAPASFRRWLNTITQNKIRDHWQRQAKSPQAQGGSDAQHLIEQIAATSDSDTNLSATDETSLLVARALELIRADFPAWYVEAFLRLVEGRESASEIAASFDQKVGAVYNAKSRILKRLRDEFRDLLEVELSE